MARVNCELCGKLVDTTQGNYIFANGISQHKQCKSTKNKLDDPEKIAYRKLTDTINEIELEASPVPIEKLPPAKWRMITSRIVRLKEQGYTYEQMEYALNWFIRIQGNKYKGFGIVEYIIEESIGFKKGLEEIEQSKAEQVDTKVEQGGFKLKVTSKPSFL